MWQPQQRKKQESARPSTTASTTYMTRKATSSSAADADPARRLRDGSAGIRFHRSDRDSDDASLRYDDGPAATPPSPSVAGRAFHRRLRGRYSRVTSRRSHPRRVVVPIAAPGFAAAGDMRAVSHVAATAAAAASAMGIPAASCGWEVGSWRSFLVGLRRGGVIYGEAPGPVRFYSAA